MLSHSQKKAIEKSIAQRSSESSSFYSSQCPLSFLLWIKNRETVDMTHLLYNKETVFLIFFVAFRTLLRNKPTEYRLNERTQDREREGGLKTT